MEIISYNVNGIRSAMNKGLIPWVQQMNLPDVLCFQEVKAEPQQVDTEAFERLGYQHYWMTAEKKGYSGVAVFTKTKPDNVVYGCGIDTYDREGRVLRLDFGGLTLINTYFPSGSSGDERQAFKMRFLADYFDYYQELKKTRPNLIICGDYNICHKPIDIHNPVSNANSSGFLPEEREWMSQFFDSGMVDTFRHFNNSPHHYSWWTFRQNARANNKGWRIDYINASEPLRDRLQAARIHPEAVHSDHCPVYLKLG